MNLFPTLFLFPLFFIQNLLLKLLSAFAFEQSPSSTFSFIVSVSSLHLLERLTTDAGSLKYCSTPIHHHSLSEHLVASTNLDSSLCGILSNHHPS